MKKDEQVVKNEENVIKEDESYTYRVEEVLEECESSILKSDHVIEAVKLMLSGLESSKDANKYQDFIATNKNQLDMLEKKKATMLVNKEKLKQYLEMANGKDKEIIERATKLLLEGLGIL